MKNKFTRLLPLTLLSGLFLALHSKAVAAGPFDIIWSGLAGIWALIANTKVQVPVGTAPLVDDPAGRGASPGRNTAPRRATDRSGSLHLRPLLKMPPLRPSSRVLPRFLPVPHVLPEDGSPGPSAGH